MTGHIEKEALERPRVRVEDGMEHIDDDILLAYTRRQELEEGQVLLIRQHLARCGRCQQKYNEYLEISSRLEVLPQIYQGEDYSSVMPGVYAKIQEMEQEERSSLVSKALWITQEVAEQGVQLTSSALQATQEVAEQGVQLVSSTFQRIRKSARRPEDIHPTLRVISLPAALALGLLLVLLAIVTVYAALSAGNRSHSNNGASTAVVSLKPQPTTKPTSGPNGGGTQSMGSTPTTGGGTKPNIQICNTANDWAHSRIRVCGSNFTPGHKVVLVYFQSGSSRGTTHPLVVDKHGKFVYVFNTNNCRSVPNSVYAQDVTTGGVRSQTLNNIPSYSQCSASTPRAASQSTGTVTPQSRP